MQPCEQAVSKTYLATEGLEVIFFSAGYVHRAIGTGSPKATEGC